MLNPNLIQLIAISLLVLLHRVTGIDESTEVHIEDINNEATIAIVDGSSIRGRGKTILAANDNLSGSFVVMDEHVRRELWGSSSSSSSASDTSSSSSYSDSDTTSASGSDSTGNSDGGSWWSFSKNSKESSSGCGCSSSSNNNKSRWWSFSSKSSEEEDCETDNDEKKRWWWSKSDSNTEEDCEDCDTSTSSKKWWQWKASKNEEDCESSSSNNKWWGGDDNDSDSDSDSESESKNSVSAYDKAKRNWRRAKRAWSFYNLLFHLDICQAQSDCEKRPPLFCGCPDCSLPHPPHFQHDYCEILENMFTNDNETEYTSLDEELSTNDGYGTEENERSFTPLLFFALASAVAIAGAACLIQKEKQRELDENSMGYQRDGIDADNTIFHGSSVAFGAALAKIGLKSLHDTGCIDVNNKKNGNPSTKSSSLKNAISTRLAKVSEGIKVSPLYYNPDQEPSSSSTSFIDMNDKNSFCYASPNATTTTNNNNLPEVLQTRDGFEVSSYRPSSYARSGSSPYII